MVPLHCCRPVPVAVNFSLKGEDVLSQILLKCDYCEELGLKLNVSSSPLSMDLKHVASHQDDLKHASFKLAESEKRGSRTIIEKPTNDQTYSILYNGIFLI
jgi:hypothetical protein